MPTHPVQSQPCGSGSAHGSRFFVKPSLVLVVDDDPDNVDLICANLELAGFRTETASDGKKAIARAFASNPDVILMDLSMPVMDGAEAEALLANDERTCRVPVLMLTAQPEWVTPATRGRCAAVLGKPCHPDQLLDAIKLALASRSLRRTDVDSWAKSGPDSSARGRRR